MQLRKEKRVRKALSHERDTVPRPNLGVKGGPTLRDGMGLSTTAEDRARFLVIKVSGSHVSESPMQHHMIDFSSNTYDHASMPLSWIRMSIGAARTSMQLEISLPP